VTGSPQRRKLVISFDDDDTATAAARPGEVVDVSLHARSDAPAGGSSPVREAWAPPSIGTEPSQEWLPPQRLTPPAAEASIPLAGDHLFASWWRRAGAIFVDSCVIWAVSLPLIVVAFAAAGNSLGGLIAAYFAISAIPAVIGLAYYPYLLARTGVRNGQTLGKQALGIRVISVSPTGPDVRGGQAVMREVVMRQVVLGGLGALLLWIPLLLDVLWPLWHPQRRSLHDLAASTIVVRTGV
jgi:uncharacterized RDD family membrane protein YckC